ncbi:condensation domain-containing protein, partial [Chitinophaga qingshengii]
FKVLLYKYTDQQDVIVGVPVAGREYPGLEEQIGFFVNTLAIRTILSGEESFSKLSVRMQEGLLEAYQYQDYPFDQLVDALKLDRDDTHAPLFDVMFSSFPAAGFPSADTA